MTPVGWQSYRGRDGKWSPAVSQPTHPLAAVRELIRDTQSLSANERLVLVVIASHANANGDSWPSAATIASIVGCSLRTVQRVIVRLVNVGRLVVRKVAGIASNVYRLVAPSSVTPTSSGAVPTSSETAVTSPSDAQSSEVGEVEKGAQARSWHRFLPKTKTPPAEQPQPKRVNAFPWRQGAALPPAAGADKCPRHIGQLRHNCSCCRSEGLGGAA